MSKTPAPSLALWGKLSRDTPGNVHPLICHLLDTGHVALAMWDRCARGRFRTWLASAFGLDEQDLAAWLPFWTSLHDLGKATPAFQSIAPEPHAPILARLRKEGFSLQTFDHRKVPHGLLTHALLRDLLAAEGWVGHVAAPMARRLATVLGGHHGVLFRPEQVLPITSTSSVVGTQQWPSARQAILSSLAKHWLPSDAPAPSPPSADDQAAWVVLAGLVSTADWIASCEDYFPYAGLDVDLDEYARHLPQRAEKALDAAGWSSWQPRSPVPAFARTFGFSRNAMQAEVQTMAQRAPGPALLLIEAPMGLGKTEAALGAAWHWLCQHQLQGVYVALPTQATSNQMFARVGAFLERMIATGQAAFQLLHGQALLNTSFRPVQPGNLAQDDEAPSTVVAQEWFLASKRGLLAPFGVGTIDQALMSVLQTRHQAVRLFGLAGKALILDEVHAYDTYTSHLLEHLLCWLGRMGSPVILLSATLPRTKRRDLIAAYLGTQPQEETIPYPRLTLAAAGKAQTISVADAPAKSVAVEIADSEPAAVIPRLRRALAAGGCAAWIRNTVRKAQEAFREVRDAFAEDACHVFLLHSRFPAARRHEIETDVVEFFGKQGWKEGSRPPKAVVVATQVIEQSLDLDFDLMVTDLAPADLVLQRAGRLHRHSQVADRPTVRPAGLRDPSLWLAVLPVEEGRVPDFGADEWVYERYVLLQTYRALVLAGRSYIRIPDDVEALIESVYGDVPAPDSAGWAEAIERARKEMARTERADQWSATENEIPHPAAEDLLCAFNLQLPDSEAEAGHTVPVTRKTAPNVRLICLHDVGGQLYLEPGVGKPVDCDARPKADMLRDLLGKSVSLTNRSIVEYFRAEEPPPGWRRSPMLRHARILRLSDMQVTLAGHTITLDPVLGLVVEKLGATEGDAP